jgi:hypothetical protein
MMKTNHTNQKKPAAGREGTRALDAGKESERDVSWRRAQLVVCGAADTAAAGERLQLPT